ncbi:zinc finger protein 664-like [Cimex lectularius]|uniref:C2H2-type domain-containing protein n=1 Tax=Cimex lectularius TaxID=79782 RepID=A0A8I6RGZ5_CIMLE|nr:zinc finger protein 664-like [Cimex lectularius]
MMEVEESTANAYENFINLETRSDLVEPQLEESLKINNLNFDTLNWHKEQDISASQAKLSDLKFLDSRTNKLYNGSRREPEVLTDLNCRDGLPLVRKDIEISKNVDQENPDAPFKCASCNKVFTSKISIRLHMLKRHRVKNLYTCELCGIRLDTSPELCNHINSEHKSIDDRYYCRKCDYNTTNYAEISSHTHENHTCKDCGRSFKTVDKFENHKLSHSKEKKLEKNFTCDTCGKRFAFGCLLRDHINLHTGAKPYLCQICGRSFSQKASLKQHTRTHNAIRPHKCTECDQGFYGKGDLKKHLRKHTGERPYVCEMCGEGFSQSSHLGFHKRTHTGERPYPCDVCGRGFTKKGDVIRHKRIHTGELPYFCLVCGKAFRQNTQCANHIKNHHPHSQVSVAPNPNPIIPPSTFQPS